VVLTSDQSMGAAPASNEHQSPHGEHLVAVLRFRDVSGFAMTMDDASNGGTNGRVTPVGAASRFERRWRLIGAGLSNMWRFGDLELPAASGRLLLRGPNGTGKTTALEALAPYLFDLNAARMSAGKARTTNLSSLMREGSAGKRRYGYAWLTLAGPTEGAWSFGVRVQYSEGASPPAKVIPFAVPGRPLHELKAHGLARAPLSLEQFSESVAAIGGQVFDSEEAYVSYIAVHLFGTPDREEIATLAGRLRQVRNPTLLGDVSPQAAAAALRASLPGVAEDVISATADALAESDATREAFTRDKEASDLLDDFGGVWRAHATDVVANSHGAAADAAREVRAQQSKVKARSNDLATATASAQLAARDFEQLQEQIASAKSEIEVLEKHQAYRDAERLSDLKKSAVAQSRAADAAARVMQTTASAVAAECDSLRRDLEHIVEDLVECRSQASSADPGAGANAPTITWTTRRRPILRVGEIVADPGAELVIHGDSGRLREAASTWLQLARHHKSLSDAATLAIADHKPVEALEKDADEKSRNARAATAAADRESTKAATADIAARGAAAKLVDELRTWTRAHPHLTEAFHTPAAGDGPTTLRGTAWDLEDVEQLANAEPALVLATCERWARHAIARAEGIAGELRARAQQARRDSGAFRDQACLLREAAKELRDGRLLPLPRPEWAGSGDDGIALGAILDWPADFTDPKERALLEAAMAAAGLLGASLSDGGIGTRLWRVEPIGPVLDESLADLVAVDATSPLASAAMAVLSRVRVASSAVSEATANVGAGICIGRDGTFTAGVLHGRVPGVDDSSLLAPASHVGAHQRRAAALARADVLDAEASQLEERATTHEEEAAQLEREAGVVSAAGGAFPLRDALLASESHRAEVVRLAREARDAATAASLVAERAGRELQGARAEWAARTRSHGLPTDLEELARLRDTGSASAEKLRMAALPLQGKLAERLDDALARYSIVEIARRLAEVEGEAHAAFRIATDTKTALRVLDETSGSAIANILARHEEAGRRLSKLQGDDGPARKKQLEATDSQATARVNLETAETQLLDAQPRAAERVGALRAVLSVPGVADAVLDSQVPAEDTQLLEQIAAKLQGRKTMAMKTMRERADGARAKLAGIWSIDPGDDHGELLTYVLTHRDTTYTPIAAAAYAEKLRQRAEHALAASEERALREFVIGRLPGAIGTAWTRLQDWVVEVNRKMRSAAASSGVGVQVRIPLREDLAPALRDVHELSCKVSSAERTADQQRRLGEGLKALLSAAVGETMQERVASAVDIREWVEVNYEVTRPGGKMQRWSSKTGLSGGERRLVVLAPMLAAIAAGYDRLGPKAPRLVTLDEVPAEVDERGREGLARYIAELDLDLICTSYLWDGCPGAWDGVDAYDLEAGPDGTVVAFPMLVRGLQPIPELGSSDADSPFEEAEE
jgi:DNA polymerase III delta prime subunit